MDHVDPGRIGVVERNDLVRFDFGVDDEPIRLVDDLLFAHSAQRRFGSVAVRQRGVLHRRQGVGGVHQGHRPAVARQPPHLTGQPVVRVHDVVVAGFVVGFRTQDAGGEGAQLGRQIVLVQSLERSRHHIAHQNPGCERYDRWIRRGRRPGEDLDFDAALGHSQRGLQDVDVHSARITGARLGQGRGVHRQYRHAPGSRGALRVGHLPWMPHSSIFTPPRRRVDR